MSLDFQRVIDHSLGVDAAQPTLTRFATMRGSGRPLHTAATASHVMALVQVPPARAVRAVGQPPYPSTGEHAELFVSFFFLHGWPPPRQRVAKHVHPGVGGSDAVGPRWHTQRHMRPTRGRLSDTAPHFFEVCSMPEYARRRAAHRPPAAADGQQQEKVTAQIEKARGLPWG